MPPEDKQKSTTRSLEIGRQICYYARYQITSLTPSSPYDFRACLQAQITKIRQNSFYSWVANSMTEKPPVDERHAKAIDVIERQILRPQILAKEKCKREGCDRCQLAVIFRQHEHHYVGLLQKSKLAMTSSPPSSS